MILYLEPRDLRWLFQSLQYLSMRDKVHSREQNKKTRCHHIFFFFFSHCNLCFLCVFQQPNMHFNGFWQYIAGLQDIVGLIASLCRWSRQKCKKDRRRKMSKMNVGPTISFFSTRSLMLHFFFFFLSQPKQFYVIFYCISQRSLTFNRYFFHNYAYTAL